MKTQLTLNDFLKLELKFLKRSIFDFLISFFAVCFLVCKLAVQSFLGTKKIARPEIDDPKSEGHIYLDHFVAER